MVDISAKPESLREAVARGSIRLRPETISCVSQGKVPKGSVLNTARVAGILAAKRVPDLVPLTHQLLLSDVAIDFTLLQRGPRSRIEIESRVRLSGKTGAEIEALTAVAVAAITIYDMCKSLDRSMKITDIRLVRKSGGKKKAVAR